jgi:hypothetical protein
MRHAVAYVFGDRHRLSRQFQLRRVEGLGHQRAFAQKEHMPPRGVGGRGVKSRILSCQQSFARLFRRLRVNRSQVQAPRLISSGWMIDEMMPIRKERWKDLGHPGVASRDLGWHSARLRNSPYGAGYRTEDDHAIPIPRARSDYGRYLAQRLSRTARDIHLLELVSLAKGDEAAVGRPEHSSHPLGSGQQPRFQRIEIANPQSAVRSRGSE